MPNPARILIIDDIAANLVLLGEVLSDLAEVQFATSGAEALALVQQSQPDLILLDVMMPEMDGYAVCEVLKSGPASRAIPLIFVTAKNDPQSESRALEAGAADFIRKPINRAVVRARVRLQLELKGRERALQQLCGTRRHRCAAHPRPQRRPRRRAGCRPHQVGLSGQHEP